MRRWLFVLLLLAPDAGAQSLRDGAAGWARAQPGPGPAADPYAGWAEERRAPMRGLLLRFCGNLRMLLPGEAFPFASEAACIARQEALLPRHCDEAGASRARPASACFAAVNRDMRSGLNALDDLAQAERARAVAAQAAPARPLPAPVLAQDALPLPAMPAAAAGPALAADAVFASAQESLWVVHVPGGAQGSAVAVGPRHALTNCHVLGRETAARLQRGGESASAQLVAADRRSDRCILQAEAATLRAVPGLRPLDDLRVGEALFAIGAPMGLELSLTSGLLSARRVLDGVPQAQTTTPLGPGSSGGGLFDARGNLVGITTSGIWEGGGFHFAIAADVFWRMPAPPR